MQTTASIQRRDNLPLLPVDQLLIMPGTGGGGGRRRREARDVEGGREAGVRVRAEHLELFRRNGFDFVERRPDGRLAPVQGGEGGGGKAGGVWGGSFIQTQQQPGAGPQAAGGSAAPAEGQAASAGGSAPAAAAAADDGVALVGPDSGAMQQRGGALAAEAGAEAAGAPTVEAEAGAGPGAMPAAEGGAAAAEGGSGWADGEDGEDGAGGGQWGDGGGASAVGAGDGDGGGGGELLLSCVPVSRATGQLGAEDVAELVALIRAGAPTGRGPGGGGGTAAVQQQRAWEEELRPSKVRSMLASRACRSSIMVGRPLSRPEMKRLLEGLAALRQPYNCPHGRPTMRHVCVLPERAAAD
ncbi:DNA mismatch repair protein PMS1 [Tetrabaena socialis]|uniref:DNA mismatch repair protein PMS1 n=1 Tax=Tetrabaena socialis TaxID=47790 RepID=A0A2J7ZMF5_9CHLO|nr:DNA mismatch repair protein PMS1 [Tetrabaena socialis]|eukprot:PNH01445.1 DNA mismatch repair protein PMS1 [Tetrabaena socialis]